MISSVLNLPVRSVWENMGWPLCWMWNVMVSWCCWRGGDAAFFTITEMVFLRYCFKILGLSNCVVCLQESSEQGWKKDRVLKRSEFTHMRFYIEINQKWSDFILVFFYLFIFYLTCHFFCTYDRFYQVYTSFRFNHGGFCSLFYQTHVNDVSFHVFLLHFSSVYLLFLITFVTFHAVLHFFPSFYFFFVQFF